MHTFNRFLVILLCLTGVIFWALFLLILWFAPTELGSALGQIGRQLRLQPALLQVVASGFGLSSVLVALLILAGEFTAQSAGTVRLTGGGRSADVSLDAVNVHLRATLTPIDGLASVRPMVRRTGASSIEVRLEVEPAGGVALPALADQLATSVKHQVETELGLSLKNVSVQFVDATGFRAEGGRQLPSIGDQTVTVPGAGFGSAPSAQTPGDAP
ncbi:MAG: hypothetical protein EXR52_05075 [Dehalococcoidia bacterium]|nr:hypothetical protein [Dehalococcoidia bacterium]